MTTLRLRLLKLFLAVVVAPGVLTAPLAGAAERPLNPKCPVLPDQDADPNIYVEYQGRKVWFCCPMCKRQFLADPQKFVAKLPQFAAPADPMPGKASVAETPGTVQTSSVPGTAPSNAESPPSKLVLFLGRFHPVVVHFPIALLLVAALAEVLYARTQRPTFASATRFLLPIAALGAVAAVVLGEAAETATHYPADLAEILEWHSGFGMSVAALAVLAAVLREWAERRPNLAAVRWAYRAALILAAALVAVTGHLGGLLVYGTNQFSWPS